MFSSRLTAILLLILLPVWLLLPSCGAGTNSSDTQIYMEESTVDIPSGDEDDVLDSAVDFFTVEPYSPEEESDEAILAFFPGGLTASLEELTPWVEACAYAALCYPEGFTGDTPSEEYLWCVLYGYYVYFGEAAMPEAEVTMPAEFLKENLASLFGEEGILPEPVPEDFCDTLVLSSSVGEAVSYTFVPGAAEGLGIRICALEMLSDGRLEITLQIKNAYFAEEQWAEVLLTPGQDTGSAGCVVSGARVWSEEEE